MARRGLDENLNLLTDKLVAMSTLVAGSVEQARRVKVLDDPIDDAEAEIDDLCVDLMRREAPLARDLRHVLASLKIASELERIGDYAHGIARLTMRLNGHKPVEGIENMSAKALEMVRQGMDLYTRDDENVRAADAQYNRIHDADNRVDRSYDRLVVELMNGMKGGEMTVDQGTFQLWVIHLVERIADRAENFGSIAYYMSTGSRGGDRDEPEGGAG